jgi:hypothetical protein
MLAAHDAIVVEHALGILARFDAAARPLVGAIRSVLQDPATAPPAVAEVGYEVARCKLTWMVVMECLSDEACDAGVRRFWLERLLIDAVALDGSMARNPTWASELRAELDREDIRAALGRGDVKHVRSRIDDPRSHLTEVDRAPWIRGERGRRASSPPCRPRDMVRRPP